VFFFFFFFSGPGDIVLRCAGLTTQAKICPSTTVQTTVDDQWQRKMNVN